MGSAVAGDQVRFWLSDPGETVVDVRVWLDLEHHLEPPAMRRAGGRWVVEIPRPPVQRLEYLYQLRYADGSKTQLCDPDNPRSVPTAFGAHSVLEFPGYAPPGWLSVPVEAGRTTALIVRALELRRPMPITIWSPEDCPAGAALPILLVHDGPEFEQLASVTRFAAAMIGSGRLPAHRVALLGPGDRNRWYAASPAYAHALSGLALPAIRGAVAVRGPVALAGASLGALAALHAAVTRPGTAGALFLQSGSFFRPDLDAQERSFGGFAVVTEFVGSLDSAGPTLRIGMTCGLAEENLANNQLMARRLAELGHQVSFDAVPDAHTYVGWRDAFDPYLVDLLTAAWLP